MLRERLLLPAVLCCLTATLVAGCGDSEDDADGAPPASATQPAPTIAAATDAPVTTAAPEAAGSTIHLKLLSFEPAEVHVPAGSTVEWVDDNPITHTVTSGTYEVGADGLRTSEKPDGTFDGKLATKGDTFSQTFDEPGTYTYFCSIHKGMNATLVVDP